MDNNQGNVNVISKENNEQNIDSTNTRNQLPHQKISIQRQPTVEVSLIFFFLKLKNILLYRLWEII